MMAQGRGARRISGIRPTALFFLLAYAISWSACIPLAMLGDTVTRGDTWPSHVPGLMGPMLAALLTTWITEGRAGLRDLVARIARWRVAPRWWLAAFSPLLFFVVAIPIARVVDGSWPDWGALDQMNGFPAIGVASAIQH